MSYGNVLTGLWRRSSPFRILLITASVLTVFIALTGPKGPLGGKSSAPSSGNNPGLGGNPASNTGLPGSSGGICAQPGTGPQAPIVVGRPSGPIPATQTPQGGYGPDIQSRITEFIVVVDAASAEPRIGERCTRMATALSKLESSDYAYAKCEQDGVKKLTAAQACVQDFQASERRFERLLSAVQAAQTDSSASLVARLASARDALTSFDETRDRWGLLSTELSRADRAVTVISASDNRIAELMRIAAATKKGASPRQTVDLANAARLQPLDKARLTTEQQAAYELGLKAIQQVNESDQRIAAVVDQVDASAVSGKQSSARRALVSAVNSLTRFDESVATASQKATISEARTLAASFAMEELLLAAEVFDPSAATANEFETLADLRAVVLKSEGAKSTGAAYDEAMSKARAAETELARSDQRLRAMREVVEAAQDGGPAAVGRRVVAAYEAINSFDKQRFSEADADEFQLLTSLRDVAIATDERRLTRSVPLFVDGEDNGATQSLREALQSAGYNLVSAKEQSAVHLTLKVVEQDQRSFTVGQSKVDTAIVSLALGGKWTVAGDSIPEVDAEGVGRGKGALDDAFSEAIASIIGSLASREAAGGR